MEFDKYTLKECEDNGKELNTVDTGDYDFDIMALYYYKRKYVVFRDSGCSCYSPWDDGKDKYKGDAFTKAALKKVLPKWLDGGRSEREMAQWINENIFGEKK